MIDHLYIKRLAAGAGFDLCGIAPCRHLAENETLFRAWLARGRQSSLGYLERNVDKRFDARRLVEGARTAVVCAVSYKNRVGEGYPPGHRTKVASYACAADYHATLRTMLGGMLDALRAAHPGLGGRAFVDTAPLAEKQLAVEAGLGWIGRQSLLVTPQYGSYVVLGELILTEETDRYDAPFEGSREPSPRTGPSTRAAASRAAPSSGNSPVKRTSTAGSSVATRARASAPGTAAPRSTATRRSIPCSTRWRWTPRRGSAWTRRRSKPSAAARR